MPRNVGVDWCELVVALGLCKLCLLFVSMPMFDPHEEALIWVVHQTVNLPVEILEPVQLHRVELLNRDITDFGPRPILERVIVQELAAK